VARARYAPAQTQQADQEGMTMQNQTQHHYVMCDDCGSQLRVRGVVTLPDHRCADRQRARPLPPIRVLRCLCGRPLENGTCVAFAENA
jgi:hypothetical protein